MLWERERERERERENSLPYLKIKKSIVNIPLLENEELFRGEIFKKISEREAQNNRQRIRKNILEA